jgi:hypothetical protein
MRLMVLTVMGLIGGLGLELARIVSLHFILVGSPND